MRIISVATALSFVVLGTSLATAQSVNIGPNGVTVSPPRPHYQPVAPPPRDELRERMFELRASCESGDRRSCVRLGIIIGEHKERREAWRREHPDLFFYER